ncbi:hypothetical protein [Arthrobacter sp. Soil762]|uniref:hypothetical protein n=1 Tax=Arthrobacter sp. Soil762 TaxID=1736401 RepID=UPI000700133C|nr:hypothetical protein [Arthrobacter sp. Soil762]KRE72614.1 hypothetical protein ASG77_08050 [Arthrobacter sp. Soil762]
MSKEPELTHRNWELAKTRADVAAYQCTLEVLSGKFESARDYAVQSQAFNEEMKRVSAVLDAQESA